MDHPMGIVNKTLLLLLICFGMSLQNASAEFLDWWLTPDQQGRFYYEQGNYTKAASLFEDLYWKGLSYYAAQDFISAAAVFKKLDSAEAKFYLGNSLAHAGKLHEAIDAYQQALLAKPTSESTKFNLDWVQGIAEFEDKEYEDAGGTGGQLKADKIVFDDRAKNAKSEMTALEAKAHGASEEQIEEMWMRRVQTTPGDFLQLKFYYQLQEQAKESFE